MKNKDSNMDDFHNLEPSDRTTRSKKYGYVGKKNSRSSAVDGASLFPLDAPALATLRENGLALVRTKDLLLFLKNPPMREQLPFMFDSGREIEYFNVRCLFCRRPISSENLRGLIWREDPEWAGWKASGFCEHCLNFSSYDVKVSQGGTFR